mgnify:CR=1 FL=1
MAMLFVWSGGFFSIVLDTQEPSTLQLILKGLSFCLLYALTKPFLSKVDDKLTSIIEDDDGSEANNDNKEEETDQDGNNDKHECISLHQQQYSLAM